MAWTGNNLNNNQPNPTQAGSNQSDVRKSVNRSYQVRRDTDKFKDISITLHDIDLAIIHHLKENLSLQVEDNGELLNVPIIYGSPEKWHAMKLNGGVRDNQGKLLLPALMISRTGVENNTELAMFNRYLNYQVLTSYNEKNKYDRFDLLTGNKPTNQIINVRMPNHVVCNYECVIWTDYVDQNNNIIEQINYATKDYWGDREKYKFRTMISNYSTDIDVDDNGDRNVKTTLTFTVNAYLLNPNIIPGMSGVQSTTQKLFTVRKIKTQEQVVTSDQLLNVENNIKINNDGVDPIVTDFEYKDGFVQKIDKNAIKTTIPTPDGDITIYKTKFHPAPKSLNEYGEDGWLAYDAEYIYVYKELKGWLKAEISTFDYDPSKQIYLSEYDCDDNPVYITGSMRPINTAFRTFQRFPDKFYQQVPLQSSDYGEDGWVSYDGDYFYIYSFNKWRRVPLNNVFS
jgi:hypothetical protein